MAIFGAAEALGRWWLTAEGMSAERTAELLIRTLEPGLRQTMNTRRVAIVGGNRIPFARANGTYAHASDQDMLTATLDGLVERFSLEGERLGEVVAGAVLKHARDRDLTREAVLGSKLAPETPAYDVQQACGTGLETVITVANKIALGQIDAGSRAGSTPPPTRRSRSTRTCATSCSTSTGRSRCRGARSSSRGCGRGRSCPRSRATPSRAPASRWASTPRRPRPSGASARRAGRARGRVARHMAAAYERGFYDDLITPYLGVARDENLRPDSTAEKLAKLKPVFVGRR